MVHARGNINNVPILFYRRIGCQWMPWEGDSTDDSLSSLRNCHSSLLLRFLIESRSSCFVTTSELSGSLYISPDIYHTQITEYLLWALLYLHSSLNIFLVFILLLETHIAISFRTGAFGNTFPVLFQLKWFLINFEQFLQTDFFVITLQNWCLIRWRLLLSGFRLVLMNATDKPLRLKYQFVSRDLIPNDRTTCTIGSKMNFFDTKLKFIYRYCIVHSRSHSNVYVLLVLLLEILGPCVSRNRVSFWDDATWRKVFRQKQWQNICHNETVYWTYLYSYTVYQSLANYPAC